MTLRKSIEFVLIAIAASMMFGIPAGLIGATIAFTAWEIGAYFITRA